MADNGYLQPVPEPTPDSKPHWDGLREGRFLVQRCGSCATLRHYPRPLCSACFSFEHDWVPVAGEGTVHSWTVCHHAFLPSFKAQLPYIVVVADLKENLRVNLPLLGVSADEVRIGMPVRIAYNPVDANLTLPALVRG
jgi:uncharacterized OB-fold protein